MVAWAGARAAAPRPDRRASTSAPRPRWPLAELASAPHELPPRLPRRQRRRLHEARAAGLAPATPCTRKPAPFFVLDTHAGAGRYDLLAGPAERTGEWRDGIARLLHEPPAAAGRAMSALVRAARPLSRLARAHPRPAAPRRPPRLLRAAPGGPRRRCAACSARDRAGRRAPPRRLGGDRAPCCRRRQTPRPGADRPAVRGAGRVRPRGRRRCATGAARFDHGVYAAWYPIKHRSPVTAFHEAHRACRAARHRRRRAVAARADRPRAAERLRPAGPQPALRLRGRRPAPILAALLRRAAASGEAGGRARDDPAHRR